MSKASPGPSAKRAANLLDEPVEGALGLLPNSSLHFRLIFTAFLDPLLAYNARLCGQR